MPKERSVKADLGKVVAAARPTNTGSAVEIGSPTMIFDGNVSPDVGVGKHKSAYPSAFSELGVYAELLDASDSRFIVAWNYQEDQYGSSYPALPQTWAVQIVRQSGDLGVDYGDYLLGPMPDVAPTGIGVINSSRAIIFYYSTDPDDGPNVGNPDAEGGGYEGTFGGFRAQLLDISGMTVTAIGDPFNLQDELLAKLPASPVVYIDSPVSMTIASDRPYGVYGYWFDSVHTPQQLHFYLNIQSDAIFLHDAVKVDGELSGDFAKMTGTGEHRFLTYATGTGFGSSSLRYVPVAMYRQDNHDLDVRAPQNFTGNDNGNAWFDWTAYQTEAGFVAVAQSLPPTVFTPIFDYDVTNVVFAGSTSWPTMTAGSATRLARTGDQSDYNPANRLWCEAPCGVMMARLVGHDSQTAPQGGSSLPYGRMVIDAEFDIIDAVSHAKAAVTQAAPLEFGVTRPPIGITRLSATVGDGQGLGLIVTNDIYDTYVADSITQEITAVHAQFYRAVCGGVVTPRGTGVVKDTRMRVAATHKPVIPHYSSATAPPPEVEGPAF